MGTMGPIDLYCSLRSIMLTSMITAAVVACIALNVCPGRQVQVHPSHLDAALDLKYLDFVGVQRRVKSHQPTAVLRDALLAVQSRLTECDINHAITFGTLLGVVREGSPLFGHNDTCRRTQNIVLYDDNPTTIASYRRHCPLEVLDPKDFIAHNRLWRLESELNHYVSALFWLPKANPGVIIVDNLLFEGFYLFLSLLVLFFLC